MAASNGNAVGASMAQLIRIEGELRACITHDALWHHLANEPVALLPFGQALVLAAADAGRRRPDRQAWKTVAVSALARVNRDAPMVRWYENIARTLWRDSAGAGGIQAFELPLHADAQDPCTADAALRHLMWVPLADGGQRARAG